MPYSRNPKTVDRSAVFLDQLVAATTDIGWKAENTHMLGYYLREAMTIAKKYKIAPYEGLKDKWIIRDRGDKIVAELRSRTPLEAMRIAIAKIVLGDIVSLNEIVGACINHKAEEMYFPDASITDEEAATLYLWANKNNYFIIVGNGITVTKSDPGDIAWTP